MWDKRNIAVGIMFALFAAFCIFAMLKGDLGRGSYTITGAFVFTIIAIAFFKRAKK